MGEILLRVTEVAERDAGRAGVPREDGVKLLEGSRKPGIGHPRIVRKPPEYARFMAG